MRCRFGITESRLRTHEVAAQETRVTGFIRHQHHVASLRHRFIHGLPDTSEVFIIVLTFHLQPVHDHFDIMDTVPVHFHAGYQFAHLAVHAYVHKTLLADGLEQFFIMTLTSLYQLSQKQDLLTRILVYDQVDDLFIGELYHRFAGQVRIGGAGSGVQQT